MTKERRNFLANLISNGEGSQALHEMIADGLTNEAIYEKTIADTISALTHYIARKTTEIEKAYGGCHICYGKGYATVNERWHGYDTDTDIGSPGGYISGGNPNAMKFCTCDRGKQLEKQVARKTVERAIEELQSIYVPEYWRTARELSPNGYTDPGEQAHADGHNRVVRDVSSQIEARIAELTKELHKLDGEQEK